MNEELNGEMPVLKKLVTAVAFTAVVFSSAPITASADPVQVHGFLQARTIVANTNYSERIHRFGFQFSQKLDDEFDWLVETYFHPSETDAPSRLYMESAFLNWHMSSKMPWDFTLRIGKGRNYTYGITPSYSSRRTSDYALYSEAFTKLRVLGFQTFSNFVDNKVQLAVALINPYRTSDGTAANPLSRPVPDFPLGLSIPIPICDRDNDIGAIVQRVALSGRLGYKDKVPVLGMLNVGASLYASQNGHDKTPAGVKMKNAVNRYGLDAEFKTDAGFMGQAQFTLAQTPVDLDSLGVEGKTDKINETALNHNGGEVLVGYEQPKYGLYARYSMLTYDNKFLDLNQIMLSAVYKIRPTIHLRLEGLINGEKEDAAKKWNKVKNDVFFFETLFAL
ncbi:MAG: hypothetical protein Q8O92_04075 [Candidatus Latescibacter sp.]|nr:hypothetical protein [Candidatus Latescibacter sp.]